MPGATFTPDPYTSGNINILGASVTGGSINLNLISNGINTQSTSVNGAGGNVVLAAFAGGAAGSGAINLSSSSTISTGGSGNGSPGHVFVVAGAIRVQQVLQVYLLVQSTLYLQANLVVRELVVWLGAILF